MAIPVAIIMSMGKASRKKKAPINDAPGGQGSSGKEVKPLQDSPSKRSPQKTTSIITLVPILIILLVSCAVYLNALSGDFVYDDKVQVVDNQWIRDTGNIPAIFTRNVWSFKGFSSNYYRPLMHIANMFSYHMFGLKPSGFHLVNILFHCGSSVLVFLIMRRFLAKESVQPSSSVYLSPPFIAALLFASHPIHTEAVTWIAGLPDVAFAFFYLLSFYLYILFRDGGKRGYLLSILSFSAAILFKEPAITLLIVLVAYDYLFRTWDRTMLSGIKIYIPYILVSGVYFLMRYHALRSFTPIPFHTGLSTYEFIINVFPLFRDYLTSLLWPFHLNLSHSFHPIGSLSGPKGMVSIFVTAVYFIVALAAYRKNRLLFFGLLLIVVPLLPVFYIKGIGGSPFAERYLYLPSVGFVFLPAIFLSWANEKLPHAVRSVTIAFIVIGGLYAVGTVSRNYVWKDDFTLWSDTVRKSPDSALAHYNLGREYKSKGLPDMAIAEFQTALQQEPENAADIHSDLGLAYKSKGLLDKAVTEYQAALKLNPEHVEARNNLGNAYASQGLSDKAVAEYKGALRSERESAESHYNLGLSYASQGRLDKAVVEYQAALKLSPDHTQAHNNLGVAYGSQGQSDKAIAEFQAVLRRKPDFIEARYNLAFTYLKKGDTDSARRELETVLKIRPDLNTARQLLNDINSRSR